MSASSHPAPGAPVDSLSASSSPLSRRTFLRAGATLAAAAPFILPSGLRAGPATPGNRITLAAIGCGGRARVNILKEFGTFPDVRVVAAVDVRQERREEFAAELNKGYGGDVCRPLLDFHEVLARPDIDGVVISTPDHWHVPMALAASRAGKDIYMEKPMGPALTWSWALRAELQRSKAVFQYGTQQRSMPQFRRACELVRNGYIGRVTRVDAWCPDMSQQFASFTVPPYGSIRPIDPPPTLDYDRWLGPAPFELYTADRATQYGLYHIYDYGLGFLSGWGAHPLDIVQWGLNKDHTSPVNCEGSGVLPPPGNLADTVERWDVTCRYDDGVELFFMSDRVARPRVEAYHYVFREHGTTFHGTEGWISVDRSAYYSHNRGVLRDVELKETDTRLPASDNHQRNFIDCVRSRGQPLSHIEAAIRSDTISHLANAAIRLGRRLLWDPRAEQFVADPEANAMLHRSMRAGYDYLKA